MTTTTPSTPETEAPRRVSEVPGYIRSSSKLDRAEIHRRSQLYARLTYATIIIVFLSVCSIAVFATMKKESEREGFRPITVQKPISFFDYTYVKKGQADRQSQAPSQH